MMKKNKSKKMNQLKYLVLIPVLISMLFYISCSESLLMQNDVELKSDKEAVSFLKIEKSPTFPGCDDGDKKCLTKMIQKHFAMNFDSDLPKKLKLKPGRKRIFIAFKINEKGDVSEIKARGPHEKIEEEVIRVMSLLPKMRPGQQKGEPVAVAYTIPFTLSISDTSTNYSSETKKEIKNFNSNNFFSVEKKPIFPGCNEGDTDCFHKKIKKHFNRNFNSDLPNQLGLASGKKRIFIGFKVNTEGNVVEVRARAPHPKIEDEVIRVMKLLPKMIPGENKEEKVAVNYNIPFVIEVK